MEKESTQRLELLDPQAIKTKKQAIPSLREFGIVRNFVDRNHDQQCYRTRIQLKQ